MNPLEKTARIRSAFYDDPEMVAMLTVRSEKEKQKVEDGLQRIAIYKGDKGDSPTDEHLLSLIEPLIPPPIQGDPGYTPVKGVDYFDGIQGKPGQNSISTHTKEIIKETIKEEFIIDDKAVKAIIKVMRTLPEKDRLDISQIRNASSFMKDGIKYKIEELMHGGSTGTSGGSTLSFETPTGTVNDTNVTFTVVNTPLYINVNGAQYTVGNGLYASFAAGTITLTSAVGVGGFIQSAYNS